MVKKQLFTHTAKYAKYLWSYSRNCKLCVCVRCVSYIVCNVIIINRLIIGMTLRNDYAIINFESNIADTKWYFLYEYIRCMWCKTNLYSKFGDEPWAMMMMALFRLVHKTICVACVYVEKCRWFMSAHSIIENRNRQSMILLLLSSKWASFSRHCWGSFKNKYLIHPTAYRRLSSKL